MTEDRLPLAELLAKAGDADFLRSDAVRRRYWARSLAGWPRVANAQPDRRTSRSPGRPRATTTC